MKSKGEEKAISKIKIWLHTPMNCSLCLHQTMESLHKKCFCNQAFTIILFYHESLEPNLKSMDKTHRKSLQSHRISKQLFEIRGPRADAPHIDPSFGSGLQYREWPKLVKFWWNLQEIWSTCEAESPSLALEASALLASICWSCCCCCNKEWRSPTLVVVVVRPPRPPTPSRSSVLKRVTSVWW